MRSVVMANIKKIKPVRSFLTLAENHIEPLMTNVMNKDGKHQKDSQAGQIFRFTLFSRVLGSPRPTIVRNELDPIPQSAVERHP